MFPKVLNNVIFTEKLMPITAKFSALMSASFLILGSPLYGVYLIP